MLDADKKQQILTLRAKGKSYASIAAELSIAKQTAIDYCKDNEETIATLKALELETLYESHHINKEARIEALSTLKDKLREEIDRRDLADIPTDKLITLYLNTTAAIKDEAIEPNFQSSKEQERDKQERETLDRLTQF